jgi:hypothetical protein
MQGAKGEAVLIVLRTLCNEADAAGSARPMGKNARFLFSPDSSQVYDLALLSHGSGRFYE